MASGGVVATSNWNVDSLLHRENGIDLLDYLMNAALILGVPALVGIGTFSILGYGMSDVLWSGSGSEVTIATSLVAAAYGVAWATNQADDFSDLDPVETVAVGGGLFVTFGIAFVPTISDLVMGSDVWGLLAAALLYGGYTVLSYL